MTKRTRAATAAALPADNHPDRRTLLASAGAAAALIASTAPAALATPVLPPADPDAELLALRPRWLAIQTAMDAEHDPRSPADLPTYRAILAAMPRLSDATSMADIERIRERRRDLIQQKPKGIEEAKADIEVRECRLAPLCREEGDLIDRFVNWPARTLAGLAFKAEVLLASEGTENDLSLSVAIDAATLGRALVGDATA